MGQSVAGGRIDQHDIGAGLRLLTVEALARNFRVSAVVASRLLGRLGVPVVVCDDGVRYFNLFAFESAMFCATLPGRPSWRISDGPPPDTAPADPDTLMVAGLLYTGLGREALEHRLSDAARYLTKQLTDGFRRARIPPNGKGGSPRH